MLASREGNESACKHLISYGCQLDCQDSCGYTALMYACREGHLPVARVLLLAGANASLSTPFGYNSLLIASLNGFSDLASLLCSYVNPNVTDVDGLTPLSCACKNNHALTVSVLLDHGADLSLSDLQGRTPVMYAIDNNSFAVLDQLLQRNIFLEYHNPKQLGVVYIAALRSNRYLTEFLVRSPLYIEEFLDDLTRFPHASTAFFTEYAVYGAIRQRCLEPELLASVLMDRAKSSAMLLIEQYLRGRTAMHLWGLVETCAWCLQVCKIGCGAEGAAELQEMEFFWRFVERVVRACANSVVSELKMERKNERESDLVDAPSDLDRETENDMNHESNCVCDQSCKAKGEMNHTVKAEQSIDHHSNVVDRSVDPTIELHHDSVDHSIELHHDSVDHSIELDDSVDHSIELDDSVDHSIELDDSVDLHHDFYPASHSKVCTNASLVPSSLLQVKLLFFFLELYCLGLSVLRASFAKRRTTYHPSSRLLTFFSANKLFLRWGRRGFVTCRILVAKYSSISKQMVYFANTFTKVFLCSSSSSSSVDSCYAL